MQDVHVTHALLTSFIVPILLPPTPPHFEFRSCLSCWFQYYYSDMQRDVLYEPWHRCTALPDYPIPPGNILMVVTLISNPLYCRRKNNVLVNDKGRVKTE